MILIWSRRFGFQLFYDSPQALSFRKGCVLVTAKDEDPLSLPRAPPADKAPQVKDVRTEIKMLTYKRATSDLSLLRLVLHDIYVHWFFHHLEHTVSQRILRVCIFFCSHICIETG